MSTLYTTEAELRTYISDAGVNLRTEHDIISAIPAAIRYASGRILFYCGDQYTALALASSDWVAYCCLILATHHLCKNRLNPDQTASEYEEVLAELKLVKEKKYVIPGIAAGRGNSPVVSNFRVDLNRYPGVRVERPRSTGTTEGYRRRTDPGAEGINRG